MSEFRYLNAGGLWPLSERRGLVVSESPARRPCFSTAMA